MGEVGLTATCLAGVLALFVWFLGTRRLSRRADPRGRGATRAHGESRSTVVDFGSWALRAALPVFRSLRVTPTFLSLLSVPMSIGAAVAVGTGHFGMGGPLLLLAFSLDAWDGLLARELGTASDAGEVIDATIDRYNDVLIMLGFLFYYRADFLPWLLASLALTGTVVVSYARAKGESFGVRTDIGGMQRPERALWLGVAVSIAPAVASLAEAQSRSRYHYPVVVALGVVALGTNLTAIRRAWLVVSTLRGRPRA